MAILKNKLGYCFVKIKDGKDRIFCCQVNKINFCQTYRKDDQLRLTVDFDSDRYGFGFDSPELDLLIASLEELFLGKEIATVPELTDSRYFVKGKDEGGRFFFVQIDKIIYYRTYIDENNQESIIVQCSEEEGRLARLSLYGQAAQKFVEDMDLFLNDQG